MKKMIFPLLLTIVFIWVSCGGEKAATPDKSDVDVSAAVTSSESTTEEPEEEKPSNRRGQLIFKQYCVICHGADGKLGISGAKDLSISELSQEERINQVTNGKGLMTPYKDILSADQIEAVVEYLEELR